MTITAATLQDVPELTMLINSAYRGESSKKGWTTEADLLSGIRIDEDSLRHTIQESGSLLLLCRDNEGAATGCVHLKQHQDHIYLGMLTVSPVLQGQGTGKLLLQAAEEKAKALGCNKIVMTVISIRYELIDWYKRRGYKDTGEKRPFPAQEKFGMPNRPLEFVVLEKVLEE